MVDDPNVNVESSVRGILSSYNRTIALLRDRRETVPLVEALQDVGDFHLTLGNVEEANKYWSDGVDALFNTLDAASHWRDILKDISGGKGDMGTFNGNLISEKLGVFGCLGAGVMLGKLSKFCCTTDQERKLENAMLAAELVRAPFSLSLPHPQRLCDFASYSPSQFCIGTNLFSDERRLDCASLITAVMEIAEILIEGDGGGYCSLALPALCLGEWVCRWVTMDIDSLTKVRLLKVQACVGAGFMAEGMSVLAKILQGRDLPDVPGRYCGGEGGKKEGEGEGGGEEGEEGGEVDGEMTRAGLPFFGLAAFHNFATVDDERNAASIAWLCGRDWESVQAGEGEEEASAEDLCYQLVKGGAHLKLDLLRAYGEEVVDLLALVRVQVVLKLIENEKLPVLVEGGGEERSEVFVGMRADARAMALELQAKLTKRIAESAVYVEPVVEEDVEVNEDGEEVEKEDKAVTVKPRLATESDIKKATQCLIFLGHMSLSTRQFREARKFAATALALMVRCSDGGMTLEEREEVGAGNASVVKKPVGSQMWLECKYLLASCALSQGRLEDVEGVVGGGVEEADEVKERIWCRRLKLVGIIAVLLEGDMEAAERGNRALISDYLEANDRQYDFVRCIVMMSTLLQQKALAEGAVAASDCFGESRKLLEDAEKSLLVLCKRNGWIGNVRLTYDDIRSNEMSADMKAPLSTALGETEFEPGFVAVVDVGDEVCPTPLANIFLKSVRWLGGVRQKIAEVRR
jgi:hypothetical protein